MKMGVGIVGTLPLQLGIETVYKSLKCKAQNPDDIQCNGTTKMQIEYKNFICMI